ncbi:toxin glutamine deamidase domain-containing protein, partial [Cronobacter dublinensis]
VQGQNALAGASGAAVGEAMGYLIAQEVYKKAPWQLDETEKQTVAALSTLASGLAGALAGNSTEAVATAAKAGQTTVENNFLGESSRKRKDELVQKGLTKGLTLDEEKELIRLDTDNQLSDEYLDKYRHDPGSLTPVERDFLNLALNAFYYENLKYYDTDTVNKLMGSLFAEGATFRDYDFPYAASSELKNKITDINKAGLGFWDALTYTRDISPEERLYKDAVSDLGVVNEHAYWARVGEPVLNFLPGAPGLVVNIKDAITGGSQMGQATASFLNDGPNADSAGRFLEGFLNAAGAVAGTHWGYKSGYAGNELVDNKAFSAINEKAGSIRDVNPGYPETGRTHNCVNCVIATDATLAGNPASALPIYHKNGVPLTVLEKQYGNKFKSVSGSEVIIQQMTEAGSGSRGIVYGSYGPSQPGHVFNVVNQNGTIRFLDGQNGKPADLSKFSSFKILRTN